MITIKRKPQSGSPIDKSVGSNVDLPLGFTLMFGAFFCFASMDTSAKWLVMAGIPSLQVAFVRYLVHFLWAVVLYLPVEGMHIVKSKRPGQQVLRALFLFGGTVLNFTGMKYLPLTITIAIFFATPLVVCLLSIPVLGEKVGLKRLSAVLMGFIGVLIIVEPWGHSFDFHVFFAIGAMLCASSYFVMTRKLAGIDNNSVSQIYSAGLATVVLLPVAINIWVWPDSTLNWFLLLFIGSFGMLGHSLLTRAHIYAEASVLAPTVYSQIIYITFFSWVIFDSPPDQNTVLGTCVIVASGFYIWYRERRINRADSAILLRSGR